MRNNGSIFEEETYRGTGIKEVSAVRLTTFGLSLISFIGVIFIVANFDEVIAKIAVFIAGLLSSGIPFLAVAVAVICSVVRSRWRWRTRFWRR